MGKNSPMLSEYNYSKESVLLKINKSVTPDKQKNMKHHL